MSVIRSASWNNKTEIIYQQRGDLTKKHLSTLGASTIPGEVIIPRLLSAMISYLPEIVL